LDAAALTLKPLIAEHGNVGQTNAPTAPVNTHARRLGRRP
jgi:hypothetical protein